jgi:hypothetical protein
MTKPRRIALLALLVLSLASCQWTTARFNAAGIAANVAESTITRDTVTQLQPEFVLQPVGTDLAPPVVAGGRLYTTAVTDNGAYGSTLVAFDAAGKQNCDTSTPRRCGPVWMSSATDFYGTSPIIAGGLVYTESSDRVAAYDLDGASTEPVWTAPLDRHYPSFGDSFGTMALTGGRLFVGEGTPTSVRLDGEIRASVRVKAFDAAGVINCSGNPRTCAPLWSTTVVDNLANPWSNPLMAATATRVFVTSDAGTVQLAASNGAILGSSPTAGWTNPIAGTDLFYGSDRGLNTVALDTSEPSMPPKWAAWGYPGALAYGRVYNFDPLLSMSVYDAAGEEGCVEMPEGPRSCEPLWTYIGNSAAPPTIAGDLVWAPQWPHYPSTDWWMYAWDAHGERNCSEGRCGPLWTLPIGSDWNPFVGGPKPWSPITVSGRIYIPTGVGTVTAFSLPEPAEL